MKNFMLKVLISDVMSLRAREVFEQRGIDVDVITDLSPENLSTKISEYDGLAVRSNTKVTAEIINAGAKLKVIGRAGIGIDNIDLSAATARGIAVMNTPFGNSVTTAEHTIAMMMSLVRAIPLANISTQAGRWEKNRFMGVEIQNKTLGLIGCGNIGAIVAGLAIGLRMKVIVFDPYISVDRANEIGVTKVEFEQLLERSDIISLHVPLNDETRNILDKDAFSNVKPDVRIVNCARGGLIDEKALKNAIDLGNVAGAALDVFTDEPALESPLFGMDEIVATPHLGASTQEAQENVAAQVAEQMSDFLIEGTVTNAVNVPSIGPEEMAALGPYLTLADQLGSFAGQLTTSGIKSVSIEYKGEVAKVNTEPMNSVILAALLRPQLDNINAVSAPLIVRERGINVREVKNIECRDYRTLVRLSVITEKQERSVSGTLFSDDKPRIVNIKGIPIEAQLTANMLYVTNEDKPGLIGGLGLTLGDAGVNIGTFALGRSKEGGDAIALISVDNSVSSSVLLALSELPAVKQVKLLRF
tara:strand:+ start:14108 stop:15697 length:1590 start_codon:yes stop_codon:yes gene_type:complete